MSSDQTPQATPETSSSEGECATAVLGGLIGRLKSVEAASDATVLTLAVASLLPVIQATMSFVGGTASSHQQSLALRGSQEAQSLAIVAESTGKLLNPPQPKSSPPAAPRERIQQLAVS